MSVYAVSKFFFDIKDNGPVIGAYKADPEAVLARYDLSGAEREAIRTGDVRTLYQMGVHPLLIRPFAMIIGVSPPDYQKAVAGLEG